jgi:hypothetical protein
MTHFKKILFSCFTLLSGLYMYGQARNASVMIDNKNCNAVMIVIDQPANITTDALQLRLAHSGLKDNPQNGVLRYKGVTLSEISSEKVDIYAKIEKGANNSSVVYMAVSIGYNNYVSSGKDSIITKNIKAFLESFVKDANNHSADILIGYQNNDVAKDEKAYQKLLDEQRDLEKQKSVIDSTLFEIQNELNVRGEEINKKKPGVEDVKTRRAGINSQ